MPVAVPEDFVRELVRLRGPSAARIHVVDVGANPLEVPPYRVLLDLELCKVTGFEPQPEALAELQATCGPNESYLPYVLGDGSPATLYVANASGFTSLFPPSRPTARMLGWKRWMSVKEEVPVVTRRLDDLEALEPADFLKIDVQGAELSIIRHGRGKLSQAVAVQTEVRLLPIYAGEPAYGELDAELSAQDFMFYDFLSQHHKPLFGPLSRRLVADAARQLVDGDALYLRNLARPRRLSDDQVLKLAILAAAVFDRPAVAVYCLDLLLGRERLDAGDAERLLEMLPAGLFRRPKAARAARQPQVPVAPAAAVAPKSPRILFTAVRNEGPFLLEWIAYHRAIGFNRIVIFENDSDDGTVGLLEALHAAGVVELHRHSPPEGVGAQINAARIANESGVLGQTGWATWLDADEFLNIHAGAGTVDDLVASLRGHEGMLVPWRIFGDGDHDRFPGRFVSEDFVRAAGADLPFRNELKTFFQVGGSVAGLSVLGINRPRLHAGRSYPGDLFLCANGSAPDAADSRTKRFYAGEDFVESAQTGTAGDGWALAQINHYMNRTPEHCVKKWYRGNGWKTGADAQNDRRRTTRFYLRMNRNEVEDRSILRHVKSLEGEMDRLRQLPGVVEAERQIDALHRDWLKQHSDEVEAMRSAVRGKVSVP